MLRADVDGLSIAFRRAGNGPELVLLHGFLFDSRAWSPQLDALSKHFTVIAWDAPGAGQSSDPPETFTVGDWAKCLAGFLDVLNIERAHIIGLSWGGILSQEFYRRYPSRVRSLVLADTYAGWRGSLSETVCEARLAECLRDASLPASEVVSKYSAGMHSEAASEDVREALERIMADFHPLGFRLMATSSAKQDLRDLLPAISVPTLLVWGDADVRSPMNVAHELYRAIPGARLAMIPAVGHLSNFEAPIEFNEAVRDFCLSLSAS
jgi:pimeloyl-ACP methyl ester carboxylesterase